MKLLTEYIERALQFEESAEEEANAKFKSELLAQADAYRKLGGSACAKIRPAAAKLTRK
jgi:hypothetical protein